MGSARSSLAAFAIAAIASIVTSAACDPGAPGWGRPQRAQRAIVDGWAETGYPAVGVLHGGGGPQCTATLIGSRTVLTAGHCVTDDESPPFNLVDDIGFALDLTSRASDGLTRNQQLATVSTRHPSHVRRPAELARPGPVAARLDSSL